MSETKRNVKKDWRRSPGGMRFITLYMPEPYIRALDRLVHEKGNYPNRAEAIRMAVRDLLVIEAWGK